MQTGSGPLCCPPPLPAPPWSAPPGPPQDASATSTYYQRLNHNTHTHHGHLGPVPRWAPDENSDLILYLVAHYDITRIQLLPFVFVW
jgi:hypothetical protein